MKLFQIILFVGIMYFIIINTIESFTLQSISGTVFKNEQYICQVDDGELTNIRVETVLVPTGTIVMWLSPLIPSGWVECDGQSTENYPELKKVIGDIIPNLNGKVLIGKQYNETLGTQLGSKTQTVKIPKHSHGLTYEGVPNTTENKFKTFPWTATMEHGGERYKFKKGSDHPMIDVKRETNATWPIEFPTHTEHSGTIDSDVVNVTQPIIYAKYIIKI